MIAELVMNEMFVVVEVAVSWQLASQQPVCVAIPPAMVPPTAPQTESGIEPDSNVNPAAKSQTPEIFDLVINPSVKT